MPIFEYTALNSIGREKPGTLNAGSLAEARRTLRSRGIHVVRVAEEDSPSAQQSGKTVRFSRRTARPREIASATRQLATLLHAGMALVPALDALVEQLRGEPLARVFARISDRISEGASLATALEEHPRLFPRLYVSMVRAGEAAGALEAVLKRLADILERRVALTGRVRSALVYPVFMSVFGFAVVVFLLYYVVPSLSKLLTDMNRALPWPTQALIAVSGWVEHYFWAIGLVAVGLIGLWRLWRRTSSGALAWDRLLLALPLAGPLLRKAAVARFARTLGVLLASGVDILDALDIVKRVVGNRVLEGVLQEARERVRHGAGLADPLRRSGAFPPVVYHMIATGEASGNLEEGLRNVATAFEEEVETNVDALTSLLEPVMILAMGLVVGFIVLAVLLPIFDINQAIG